MAEGQGYFLLSLLTFRARTNGGGASLSLLTEPHGPPVAAQAPAHNFIPFFQPLCRTWRGTFPLSLPFVLVVLLVFHVSVYLKQMNKDRHAQRAGFGAPCSGSSPPSLSSAPQRPLGGSSLGTLRGALRVLSTEGGSPGMPAHQSEDSLGSGCSSRPSLEVLEGRQARQLAEREQAGLAQEGGRLFPVPSDPAGQGTSSPVFSLSGIWLQSTLLPAAWATTPSCLRLLKQATQLFSIFLLLSQTNANLQWG